MRDLVSDRVDGIPEVASGLHMHIHIQHAHMYKNKN